MKTSISGLYRAISIPYIVLTKIIISLQGHMCHFLVTKVCRNLQMVDIAIYVIIIPGLIWVNFLKIIFFVIFFLTINMQSLCNEGSTYCWPVHTKMFSYLVLCKMKSFWLPSLVPRRKIGTGYEATDSHKCKSFEHARGALVSLPCNNVANRSM